MSRTIGHGTGNRANGRKGPGYEYWSGRPGPIDPGKSSKKITHHIERARRREELKRIIKGEDE